MKITKYDIAVHLEGENYYSDPRFWDKRKLKKHLRIVIGCSDVKMITIGKYRNIKKGSFDYAGNGLTMVADRLFAKKVSDLIGLK